jgi:hypothetical protein
VAAGYAEPRARGDALNRGRGEASTCEPGRRAVKEAALQPDSGTSPSRARRRAR